MKSNNKSSRLGTRNRNTVRSKKEKLAEGRGVEREEISMSEAQRTRENIRETK